MRITIKLFAILKDKAGVSELQIDLPAGARAADAIDCVARAHPTLANLLPRAAIAVNRAYAPPTTPLTDHDEVALIPPVSGG